MSKAADAFRTISEVADELEVPKHVLRFWENRFPQIKPMKRGGGRRYYRPADMDLLRGIRHLLHNEGYTIKGVQRILREKGLDAVKNSKQAGKSVTATSPPAPTAPQAVKGRKTRAGKVAPRKTTPTDRKQLLALITSELLACRALLVGGQSEPASTPARSRR